MKFFWVLPWHVICMIVKLSSPLENEEQLILLRILGKIATSAQTDGQITTGRPLYTGIFYWVKNQSIWQFSLPVFPALAVLLHIFF